MSITITGTGTIVTATLPTTPSVSGVGAICAARELNVTGAVWVGTISPNFNTMSLVNTSNSASVTNGWRIVVSGSYETT